MGPVSSRRENHQIGDIGLDQHVVQTPLSGQDVRQTWFGRDLKELRGVPSHCISIDQDGAKIFLGRKGQCQIDRAECLAFTRTGAGHYDDLWRLVRRP